MKGTFNFDYTDAYNNKMMESVLTNIIHSWQTKVPVYTSIPTEGFLAISPPSTPPTWSWSRHPSLPLSTDEGPFPSQALRWHWCWHKTGKVTKSDVIYWGLKIIWSWLGPSQASDERYQRQGKRSGTCSPPCAVANAYKNIFHQRSKFMSRNDDPPLLCSLITLATFCNLCCLVTFWVTGLGMAGHSSTGGLVHKISQRVYFWWWDKSIILFCLPTRPWIIQKYHPTLNTRWCHAKLLFLHQPGVS